jgi:hypothetical protein
MASERKEGHRWRLHHHPADAPLLDVDGDLC